MIKLEGTGRRVDMDRVACHGDATDFAPMTSRQIGDAMARPYISVVGGVLKANMRRWKPITVAVTQIGEMIVKAWEIRPVQKLGARQARRARQHGHAGGRPPPARRPAHRSSTRRRENAHPLALKASRRQILAAVRPTCAGNGIPHGHGTLSSPAPSRPVASTTLRQLIRAGPSARSNEKAQIAHPRHNRQKARVVFHRQTENSAKQRRLGHQSVRSILSSACQLSRP